MPTTSDTALLGGLTPKAFLRRYWQKKPCLIRQALPGYRSPLTPEELAGLACEAGVEARLVRQTTRRPYWQVQHGPLTGRDFARLPSKRWTLLVQDVDKHVPPVAKLLQPFRFVPDWRVDDVMISYAVDGGSVGPHVDAYDVFLLQVQGLRRWDISTRPHQDAELPGLELKQVKGFKPEDSWLLFPGDMLYLPPGVAHHGVAVGDCMTYSVGFRAPAETEMLADFTALLPGTADRNSRYADPDLRPADKSPGELHPEARRRARTLLRNRMQPSDAELDIWFGRFLTDIKAWLRPEPRTRPYTLAQLKQHLRKGGILEWQAAARRAWFPSSAGCQLFVCGRHYALPASLTPLGRKIGNGEPLQAERLLRHMNNPLVSRLLLDVVNAGELRWRR